jgi:Peptidase C13 family
MPATKIPQFTAILRRARFALAVCLATAAPIFARADQALIAAQPALVAAAVEQIAPQRPGITDVFFIGFAGYGGQQVFRKEAEFAREAFDRRYGTASRSLLLVNDEKERNAYPIASRTNLRHALRLIGARMDPREDVLILLLTSHGIEKRGLEVSNGDLPLAALEPQELRDALDEAGIHWRIVIASACFAGVFIPPLRDETTFVVTAADARHSSFGCEDDRDLTWFGEALLRDALPDASSLEAAFAEAREIVRRRERAERHEHSRPQIFVGRDMRSKLEQLEATRASREPRPAARVN